MSCEITIPESSWMQQEIWRLKDKFLQHHPTAECSTAPVHGTAGQRAQATNNTTG